MKQKENSKFQNESCHPDDLVLVGCRESRYIAEALTQMAIQKGMSRSKLLSQLIHQSLQNNSCRPYKSPRPQQILWMLVPIATALILAAIYIHSDFHSAPQLPEILK